MRLASRTWNAIGAALFLLAVGGMALILQPVREPLDTVMALLLCILPGLFIMGLAGIYWVLVARGEKHRPGG